MTKTATALRVCVTPMNWTLEDVVSATGAQAEPVVRRDVRFASIATDSRQPQPGALFFALRGERHDGHAFVAEALRQGASCAVVDHEPDGVPIDRLLRVSNTLSALGDLAAWTRRQHPVRVIAVTGSNGKTTTKEMIAAICAAADFPPPCMRVLKSEGNFNNLIGLPLTLLQLQGNEAVAVLEMGMNHPGEIARLTKIAQPNYGVVTNVGPAHLEGVGGTLAGVAAAKGELFAGLSSDATIAVNVDDEWVRRIAAPFPGRHVTFGRSGEVRAWDVKDLGIEGLAFHLLIGAQRALVRLRFVGLHNVMNALAAAAIGHALGLSIETIARGLAHAVGAGQRMQVTRLANGVMLLNDAYNANPSSVDAALVALRRFPGRSVVVLGEMWELGDESRRAHYAVGERAASLGVHQLVLLGAQTEAVAAGAHAAGMPADTICLCQSHAEVAAAVVARWQPGDTVLIKGSHGMRMEEVVRLLESAGRAS